MFDSPELVAFDSQLSEIDSKIAEIGSKLAELQVQRDALLFQQARIAHLRAVYVAARAPWRCLPVELICEIFVKLLDEEICSKSRAVYTLPTTISLVSTEWRAFALADPRLWSNVKVEYRGGRTARTWLERSKSAPVTLGCILYYNMPDGFFQKTLDLIHNHRHHIFDLRVAARTETEFVSIMRASNHPFPMLNAFSVRRGGMQGGDGWAIPYNVAKRVFGGGQCPNLRTLGVQSSCSSWPVELFGNLTQLTLSETRPDPHGSEPRVLRLLEHAPNIVDLTVRLDRRAYTLDGTLPEPVTLSTIISLSIEGFCDDVVGLLNCIHLPNLHSLTITSQAYAMPPDTWALPGAVAPFPILERLEFTEVLIPGETVSEYIPHALRRCDNIKELHIQDDLHPLSALIRHLDGKDRPMCPHLMHLHLELNGHFYDEDKVLRNFLSTRSRTNPDGTSMAPLQTLSFHDYCLKPSKDFIKRAASYRRLVTKSVHCNEIKL